MYVSLVVDVWMISICYFDVIRWVIWINAGVVVLDEKMFDEFNMTMALIINILHQVLEYYQGRVYLQVMLI